MSKTLAYSSVGIVDISDGNGVSQSIVDYQVSASGSSAPGTPITEGGDPVVDINGVQLTDGWSTTIPTVSEGQYLWTRTRTIYTDDTFVIAYNVSRNGVSGTNGKKIIVIDTATRNFTVQQWNTYGVKGTSTNWATGVSYDNSDVNIGDIGIIQGFVSNAYDSSGTQIQAAIYGEVTAVSTSQVTMTCVQLVIGATGATGARGISVTAVVPEYCYSTSPTQLPVNPSWSEQKTEITEANHLYEWIRYRTDYDSGPSSYSTATCDITMSGVVFDVDKINGDIESKVWQSDINSSISTYDTNTVTTIRDRVSDVEQDLDGIMLQVLDISTTTVGDETTYTSSRISTIEQDASSFRTTVSNTYATKSELNSKNVFILGTQTAATNTWTGTTDKISTLSDGQEISYWLPYAGTTSAATLNLTLSNGTATGAIPCYYGGTTRMTTHYAAGNVIHMTYRTNVTVGSTTITQGWWGDANYNTDSNTYDRTRYNGNIKAASAITAQNIIVGNSSGYHHLKTGGAFDITYPILYAESNIASGGVGTNNYTMYPVTIATTQSLTLTAYKSLYIKGTLSLNTFTPISTAPITQTEPTTEDNYYYMLLGTAYSTTAFYLLPDHPIYMFKAGQGFANVATIAKTIAEQTADGFSWIVADGSSSSSVTYTSQALTAMANQIDLTGKVTFNSMNSALQQRITDVESVADSAIIDVNVEYANGTSSTTVPTTGWSTTAPEWEDGKYLWQRTVTTYGDNSTDTSDATCLTGATGDTGKGVFAVVEQYYLSSSQNVQTGGTWSNDQPQWTSGKYIWTRSAITWTDNTTTYTDPVLAKAINNANSMANTANENSADAVNAVNSSIQSTTMHYLATSADSGVTKTTSGWTTSVQSMTATNKYLWTYQTITKVDDSTYDTDPVISGVYGDRGATGATGTSVTKVEQLYRTSNSTTAPAKPTSTITSTSTTYNTWTLAMPTYNTSYPYYYTCTQTTYSDGSHTWTTVARSQAIEDANKTANTANTTANSANETANAASQTANSASQTANSANQTANNADNKSNQALNGIKAFIGSSSTATGTAAKVVSCSDTTFALTNGVAITVTFSAANTADAPTLNVNSLGAKAIYFDNAVTSSSNKFRWQAGSVITFQYNGTYWVVINYENLEYFTSSTAAGTAAKTNASATGTFVLCRGTTINVYFSTANSANAPTLNIGATGAYAIYYKNAVTSSSNKYLWDAGTTLTFTFNGSYWYVNDGGAQIVKDYASTAVNWVGTNGSTVVTAADIMKTWVDDATLATTTIDGGYIKTHTIEAEQLATDAIMSSNYVAISGSHFSSTGSYLDLENGNFYTPNFGVSAESESTGAYINGEVVATSGTIGSNSTNYWGIGNVYNYNATESAAIIGHGTSYIQSGNWQLSNNKFNTQYYFSDAQSSGVLQYYKDSATNTFYDVGMKIPTDFSSTVASSLAGRFAQAFYYGRKYTGNTAPSLDGSWTYFYMLDTSGNLYTAGNLEVDGDIYEGGTKLSDKYAAITDVGSAYLPKTGGTVGYLTVSGAVSTTLQIRTNLASTSAATFTGNASAIITPGVNGTLGVGNGGTGKSSWTAYGIVYASASNTLAQVAAGSASNKNYVLLSNGAAAPIWSAQSSLSVGSATKATQDGSGNVIVNTYMPIAGGQFTGAVTVADELSADSAQLGSLVVTGAARFNNDVYADSFTGNLVGTASDAVKATKDGDGNTISSTYLKLSGGTMTGVLTLKGGQYADGYNGALNMNNSDIYGLNSIYTADVADNAGEGLHFYRTSTTVDTIWVSGGNIYFVPNRTLGTGTTAANSNIVLHSGNYNSYAPKLDGTGATGSWGISVTGSAGTAGAFSSAKSVTLTGDTTGTASSTGGWSVATTTTKISTVGDNRAVATTPDDYVNKIIFQGLKTNSKIGSPSTDTYSYLVGLRGWADDSGGHSHELAFNNSGINYRIATSSSAWGSWAKLISSSNYTDYTVTKTGTGASGTWGISITGNADTATSAVNVTGTVAVGNGGTGLTSSPSMLVNLGSTSADTILKASPRPGITGTLPIANGGTGATTASGAKSNIGLSNVTNNKQVKGLSSGTTSGHLVSWGSDGYTVADSGLTSSGLLSSISISGDQLTITKADGSSSTSTITITASQASGATILTNANGNAVSLGSATAPVYFNNGTPAQANSIPKLNNTTTGGTFYAPTGTGTSNQVLISSGSGAPTWTNQSNLSVGSAGQLTTARTIELTGDVSGSVTFNGSDNVSMATTVANDSHTHLVTNLTTENSVVSNGLDPVTSAYIGSASSNKSFGLPANAITIEYSTDGGSTWVDYGATDTQKRDLFAETRATNFILGKSSSKSTNTTNNRLRITIEPKDRYTSFHGIYVWFSTQGNTCYMDLERSTIGAKDTFTNVFTNQQVGGWSGNNIRYFAYGTFGGGSTQTSNAYKYRVTFKQTAINANYNSAVVNDIRFIGANVWNSPNNMVAKNHMYTWDSDLNVTFPAEVTATSFTGDLSGNATSATSATTATKFSSSRTIALTGDTTGSASGDGSSGWSIATTTSTLTHKTLDSTTINNTAGTFAFSGSGAPWDGTDWVGFQVGDLVDKFQISANGNTLVFRQNDNGGTNTSWSNWVTMLTSANYTSYTVTKTGTGASGTWGISISGNAATATTATSAGKLNTNAGSTTQPVYFSNGVPTATSYSLSSSVNSGSATKLAYYSDANVISSSSSVYCINNVSVTSGTDAGNQNGLKISATCYGNTASHLKSNTQGVFRYGDPGAQIQFSTGTQSGALIFTDNDSAGAGLSWHFVSNQSDDDYGGNATVSAPRFRARKGLAIGQNADNTSYALYTNGSGYFSSSVSVNGINVNIDNSSTDGGLALWGTNPSNYGIAMRGTSNGGKHGYVQGDWAIYSYMSGTSAENSLTRGWALKNTTTDSCVASVSGAGNAVFNGSITVGGNTTNTSGCEMVFDSTLNALCFQFK